jgi:hypothetical protein
MLCCVVLNGVVLCCAVLWCVLCVEVWRCSVVIVGQVLGYRVLGYVCTVRLGLQCSRVIGLV